jgi:hemolysin activation/secretion protein
MAFQPKEEQMDLRLPFKLATTAAVFLITESLSVAAFAATPISLPGSVLPDQVARQLSPQMSAVPSGVAPPRVNNQDNSPSSAPLSDAAKKIKFELNEVVLTGNHVFTTEQLSILYKSKVHTSITVGELFEIVQNITNFYRNNGYIISRAILPPQHVKGGTVKIQIIEGYLDQVAVTGSPGGSKCLVEGFGFRIRKCPPLKLTHLEHYMLLVNEVPNTQVKAVLAPSKASAGAADLNLETYSKPMSAYFSYDNYGTRYIGPQQMTGNVTLYSAINSGDSTSLTFTKTPKGGQLTFLDLNYNGPLGDQGTRWLLGGTRVHTHPLFVLQPTQTDGFNSNFYTNIIYPFIRSRSQSLNLTAGFNYLDSNTTILDTPLFADHLRNLDVGFNYNFADRFYGANMLAFNFRKGLPIWGYSSNTDQLTAETSRPGGYAAYTKMAMQVSRLQAIKGSVSLLMVARGQWAFVPLLSSEQFTFGGNPLGRGYDPAELIGDRGASGSLELRYDLNMSYFVRSLQLYSYYDIGSIWNILVNASSPTKVSASSAGLGVRFSMSKYVSGNLMWTQPLTKTVAAEEIINQGWRPRTFFSVVASFD